MNRLFSFMRVKRRIGWADVIVTVMVVGLLYAILDLGRGMTLPISPSEQTSINLDPAYLPYYAGRSLLRMFLAFFLSLAFTLVYGRTAAYNKTAEKILIPALDILQSVPILGFLSVTITFFLGLFPHSLLGAEFASIFLIFTSQAWNMTFSFYHSLTTIPKDLREAASINRLRPWARFTTLEVPFAMIPLVWNSMMSFGGAWFFLISSEMISVMHYNIVLPGIGSYIGTALDHGDTSAIVYGILAMIAVIVAVDQLFWRPLVAWSHKFKLDLNEDADVPTSWFLQLIRRSQWVGSALALLARPLKAPAPRLRSARSTRVLKPEDARRRRRLEQSVTVLLLVGLILLAAWYAVGAVREIWSLGTANILSVVKLGFYTMLRVVACTALGALWTIPVGVLIGLRPRLSRVAQPLVQIAASFPANILYPIIGGLFIAWSLSLNFWSVPLTMLGTQWYILFNVIAGAMAIPNDLKEASSILRLRSWTRWKTFILPAIYPSLITGGITAMGGAWNASIVSELVTVPHHAPLAAAGIGAFIDRATSEGNWAQITWGIAVMSLFVVATNRFVWRPLYRLAETKYRLE